MLSGTYLRQAGWIARSDLARSYTSPSSSTSPRFSQLTAWRWVWFPNLDFTPSPLFPSRQTERNATTEAAALIRNQLAPQIPGPLQKRLQDVISTGLLLRTEPSALICREFTGKSKMTSGRATPLLWPDLHIICGRQRLISFGPQFVSPM